MLRLAVAFLDIALHRRGPDELPASSFLFGLLVALYLLLGVVSLGTLGVLTTADVVLLPVDCAFFLAFVFVVLRLFGREARFRQTASALLGVDVLLNLIGLPLAVWARALAVPPEPTSMPMLLRLLLLLWLIDASGFILSRAIARVYIVGVLFVILYVMTSLSLRDLLAPATG